MAWTRTVTLSDDEFAALQAIRPIVGDSPHPARPAAIAALERIAAAPADGAIHGESGAQPLDLSQPEGHHCSTMVWDNTRGNPMADIAIAPGHDLHLALTRPNDAVIMRWTPVILRSAPTSVALPMRALYRLCCSLYTRPMG